MAVDVHSTEQINAAARGAPSRVLLDDLTLAPTWCTHTHRRTHTLMDISLSLDWGGRQTLHDTESTFASQSVPAPQSLLVLDRPLITDVAVIVQTNPNTVLLLLFATNQQTTCPSTRLKCVPTGTAA